MGPKLLISDEIIGLQHKPRLMGRFFTTLGAIMTFLGIIVTVAAVLRADPLFPVILFPGISAIILIFGLTSLLKSNYEYVYIDGLARTVIFSVSGTKKVSILPIDEVNGFSLSPLGPDVNLYNLVLTTVTGRKITLLPRLSQDWKTYKNALEELELYLDVKKHQAFMA